MGEGTVNKALEGWENIQKGLDFGKFFNKCQKDKNTRIRKIGENRDIVRRNMRVISLRYFDDGFVKDLDPDVKEEISKVFFKKRKKTC